MLNYSTLFSILKRRVLDVAGLKSISTADCKPLSILLFKKTGKYISETTIKRIYGFAQAKFEASAYTKDVLAQFCDNDNWTDYIARASISGSVAGSDPSGPVALPEVNVLGNHFMDTVPVRISILQAVYSETGAIRDFRIDLVSRELEKAAGREDLPGKLYGEEYPGIKLTGLYELMLKVMETGQPERIDYYYPFEGFNKWYSSTVVRTAVGLLVTYCDLPDATA